LNGELAVAQAGAADLQRAAFDEVAVQQRVPELAVGALPGLLVGGGVNRRFLVGAGERGCADDHLAVAVAVDEGVLAVAGVEDVGVVAGAALQGVVAGAADQGCRRRRRRQARLHRLPPIECRFHLGHSIGTRHSLKNFDLSSPTKKSS